MPEKHSVYFNLLDALKETGCPICFLVKKSAHKFMDDILYENVNDPGVRDNIRKAGGFCNRHAWQLRKIGDGFGLGIVYEELMRLGLKELQAPAGFQMKEEAEKPCIVCNEERDVAGRYISVFLEHFDDAELKLSYKNSFGFCSPHLNLAIKMCRNKKSVKEIIDIESAKVNGLLDELKEFHRKHGYRFTKDRFGEDFYSWTRAIEKMIGKEGIS